METLGKLFGSANKVKLMRLFVLNPELQVGSAEVAKRARIASPAAVRELKLLSSIDLIHKKRKNNAVCWQLNSNFPILNSLKNIIKSKVLDQKRELINQFNRCGRINLLIAAGALIENPDSRADLLVVGDRVKKGAVDRVVKGLEAEMGCELSYAVLETGDFTYRLNASDRFLRDILDYPHEQLVNRIGFAYN